MARTRRRGEAGRVSRRDVLGAPGARLRRSVGAGADRRAGAGGARGQPHRPGVHRRPFGRLALRLAASTRLREPSRRRCRWTTGSSCTTRTWQPQCGARRRTTSPRPRSAIGACRTSQRELALLDRVRVVVVLGGFAYEALARVLAACDSPLPVPRPKFGHGLEVPTERFVVLGCYHPSQQNTFTGRLTEPMIDDVFRRAERGHGSSANGLRLILGVSRGRAPGCEAAESGGTGAVAPGGLRPAHHPVRGRRLRRPRRDRPPVPRVPRRRLRRDRGPRHHRGDVVARSRRAAGGDRPVRGRVRRARRPADRRRGHATTR